MMRVFAVLLALFLATTPTLAQSLEITADTFTVSEAGRSSVFSGNVVVRQGAMTLTAGTISVAYGAGGATDIASFEATGGVRVTTGSQSISGERAVYDPVGRILRVSGNVSVVSAQGTLSGPELIINLIDQTTTFSGDGNGRVQGVFNP